LGVLALVSQLFHPRAGVDFFEQILCGKLENDFITAGYLFIDTEKQTATHAGAGHPPLLLLRRSEQKIHEYRKTELFWVSLTMPSIRILSLTLYQVIVVYYIPMALSKQPMPPENFLAGTVLKSLSHPMATCTLVS
jgi:hypothetical protein